MWERERIEGRRERTRERGRQGTSAILQTMKCPSLPQPSVELIERESTRKKRGRIARLIEPMSPISFFKSMTLIYRDKIG